MARGGATTTSGRRTTTTTTTTTGSTMGSMKARDGAMATTTTTTTTTHGRDVGFPHSTGAPPGMMLAPTTTGATTMTGPPPPGMMMMAMPMMMMPLPPQRDVAVEYDTATARVAVASWQLERVLEAQREAFARFSATKALPQVAIAQARETARARARAVARANAAQIVAEQAGDVSRGGNREAAATLATTTTTENASSSQKQWPIVPQVSTAVCPPRGLNATRSIPGDFGQGPRKTSSSGQREAVNAGVQVANCAKSKAKNSQTLTRDASDATVAAAKATAAASNARVTRRSSSSQLESLLLEPKASTAKRQQQRVDEAKVLLDPACSIDGLDPIDGGATTKRLRSERSNAPSPESTSRDDAAKAGGRDLSPRRNVHDKALATDTVRDEDTTTTTPTTRS